MAVTKSIAYALFLALVLAVANVTSSNSEERKSDDAIANVFALLADTTAEHLGDVGSARRSSTRHLEKQIGKFGSFLNPLSKSLGSLGWGKDVPDKVGIANAWVDFLQSGYFVSAGGILGGGLGSLLGPPGIYIGAGVGGYIGGVVYNFTIGEVTEDIADVVADKASNETDADRKKRRERVNKATRKRERRNQAYKSRCKEYQRDFEKSPSLVIGVVSPNMKRCLDLGVDVLRSKNCRESTRWHKYLGKCASNYEFFVYCKNKYPGSRPNLKAPSLCACPRGSKLSRDRRRCVTKGKRQRTTPSGKFSALCAIAKGGTPTFVWDRRGRRYGCQDPRLGSRNFSARKPPIIVAVPGQVKGMKIDCPVSSWPPKYVRVKCVPKNSRSPGPGYCATYKLYRVNKRITQKYCYYLQ